MGFLAFCIIMVVFVMLAVALVLVAAWCVMMLVVYLLEEWEDSLA